MFDKALRAFETGGLSFSDLRLTLKQQLADGAPPEELLKTLRRRELIEPLPESAHEEILAILESDDASVVSVDDATLEDGASATPYTLDENELSPDRDFDESTMSRLMQSLKSEWAAEPPDVSTLATEINTLRAAFGKRDEELESLRKEHTRVLGLLESRARSVQQLEGDLRAHASELSAAKEALQMQQHMNRELSEALAEKLAASDAARAREAEVAARTAEVSRGAERHRAESAALHDAAAASDAALREARRSLEEREAALQQARRALDERDSALEKMRYTLGEHQTALDQARQLVGDRDAQIVALLQKQADATQPLASGAQSDQLRAELQAALEHTAALDHSAAMERTTAYERMSALEADLMAAHAALGAEQKKVRRLDAMLAENTSLLAERNALLAEKNALLTEKEALLKGRNTDAGEKSALSSKLSALHAALEARNAELAAQRQEHAKALPGYAARIKALEDELKEARQRNESLNSALNASRASAATRAASERTRPAVQVGEFTPAPRVKRNIDIREFALSPPIEWLRNRFVRMAGICLLVVAAGIGIRAMLAHRPNAATVPLASSAAPPLPGSVIQDCEACPALTVLPAGRFKQGSGEAGASAFVKPMHWVAIGNPFAMSTNDVTVAEFRAFVTATGRDMRGCDVYDGQWKHQQTSGWQNPGFEQTGTHPVTCASWEDAKAYAQWLSAQTGHHYRLPSASEWEYAARAGGEAAHPWSGNGADACANANVADSTAAHRFPGWVAFACSDGYVFTSPVGTFKASAFGLNDMLGNVFQWTEDCWNPNYVRAPIDGSARADGNCNEHELRGGSWFSFPEFVRADYRNHFAADYRASSIGIRLVRDLTS